MKLIYQLCDLFTYKNQPYVFGPGEISAFTSNYMCSQEIKIKDGREWGDGYPIILP